MDASCEERKGAGVRVGVGRLLLLLPGPGCLLIVGGEGISTMGVGRTRAIAEGCEPMERSSGLLIQLVTAS